MKFKAGDLGEVFSLRYDEMLCVTIDVGRIAERKIFAHPKQCRLLKKKPKYSPCIIGITAEPIDAGQAVYVEWKTGLVRRSK